MTLMFFGTLTDNFELIRAMARFPHKFFLFLVTIKFVTYKSEQDTGSLFLSHLFNQMAFHCHIPVYILEQQCKFFLQIQTLSQPYAAPALKGKE